MTDRDALRDVLAEALRDIDAAAGHDRTEVEWWLPRADAILAHPAVLAALDRSGPAEGLREALEDVRSLMAMDPCDCAVHRDSHIVTDALAATPTASPTDRERLAEIVSDSLAATTEGTDYAEAPEPSDEPGSPYVLRLTNEIASRMDRAASPTAGGLDEWGAALDMAEYAVWFARRSNGRARDVAQRLLDQHPGIRAALQSEATATGEGS